MVGSPRPVHSKLGLAASRGGRSPVRQNKRRSSDGGQESKRQRLLTGPPQTNKKPHQRTATRDECEMNGERCDNSGVGQVEDSQDILFGSGNRRFGPFGQRTRGEESQEDRGNPFEDREGQPDGGGHKRLSDHGVTMEKTGLKWQLTTTVDRQNLLFPKPREGRKRWRIATLNMKSSLRRNMTRIPELMNENSIDILVLSVIDRCQSIQIQGVTIHCKESNRVAIASSSRLQLLQHQKRHLLAKDDQGIWIVGAYAPHTRYDIDARARFYTDLDETIQKIDSTGPIILIGDLNAGETNIKQASGPENIQLLQKWASAHQM